MTNSSMLTMLGDILESAWFPGLDQGFPPFPRRPAKESRCDTNDLPLPKARTRPTMTDMRACVRGNSV